MVTTRNMRKRKSGDDLDLAAPSSPQELTSTTPPKRQRKLPVRAKAKKQGAKSAPEADDDAEVEDETFDASESPAPGDSSLIVEIRAKNDDDERGLSGSIEDEEADAADETVIPGAEQPAPEPEATQKDTINDSDASDSDSDDEAPEAVSTSAAAAAVFESAKAANKAIAEQQKAQKRKRQQRTTFLQDQAETRKAAAASIPATPAAARASPSDDITPRTQLALESSAAFKKRASTAAVPALLPAEFLDSDDSDADDEPQADADAAAAVRPRKSRKIALDKAPRDEVVGSTVYRVAAAKQDVRLAPRGGKASVNAKRALLVRGRTGKAASKGFFVK
ncbi:hypothetical protein ACHAQA_001395 [Verticillium albo-atrum]